jgi:hypothetical protein
VRDCIEQHVDRAKVEILRAAEKVERGILERLAPFYSRENVEGSLEFMSQYPDGGEEE